MKKEEQLLRALGGVKAGFILEASQYVGNPQRVLTPRKKKKWSGAAAMAASLAVVLTGLLCYAMFTGKTAQTTQDLAQTNQQEETVKAELTLPEGWPGFRMEYDSTRLELVPSDDGLVLCPIQYDQELPICELKIEFLPKLLPYAAMTQSRQELSEESIIIGQDQQTARYSFHIAQGTVWDSHMADIYIVPAGSYGSYRLTSKYFTEAAEGWGTEFAKICGSFTCPLEESPNAEAEKVIMDFAEGFFSADQVAMLSSFYGDSKDLREVYTGDPSRVRLVTLDGMEYLDSRIESSGYAPISLTFRESEDADSYTYLSVKVVKTQAGYRISAYGLDK